MLGCSNRKGHVHSGTRAEHRPQPAAAPELAGQRRQDPPEGGAARTHHSVGQRRDPQSRHRAPAGHHAPNRVAVESAFPAAGNGGVAARRAAAGAQESDCTRGGQTGGRSDPALHPAGGHPLDHPHHGQGVSPLAHGGAANLAAARLAAAPGRDLQALARCPLCRETARRGRSVSRPSRQSAGALGRREEPDSGA